MKKNVIELVSVTVKINGEEKTFSKENCIFEGWEWSCGDECGCGACSSGVDLHLTDGRKRYKLEL
jgi:hypothetical protein